MVHLHQWRRFVVYCIVLVSISILICCWLGHLTLFHERGESSTDTLVANIVETTATVGGITLAMVFVTAQLSSGTIRQTLIRELYRSGEVYILALFMLLTVIIGFSLLADVPHSLLAAIGCPSLVSAARQNLVEALLVFAVASALLVVPTLALQIENLDPLALASKIAGRISVKAVKDYAQTSVSSDTEWPSGYRFELSKVGLRPRDVDPLRPIHEVLMEAVRARDRVLFGKLLRHLLRRIAVVHGARWDLTGQSVGTRRTVAGRYLKLRRYHKADGLHVTLMIVHYCVKRARNFVTEWKDPDGQPLDIGRHGILTGLGDLILVLADVPGVRGAIRICLYGALHTCRVFAGVKPFGRIEPLSIFFVAARALEKAGKLPEAELCAEILAWCAVRTKQIEGDRALHMAGVLPERVLAHFSESKVQAASDRNWLPGDRNEDPWNKN